MSGIAPGSFPSRKLFIHEVSNATVGSKVRFLGCVNAYDVAAAKLTLAHHYPQERQQAAMVFVDITTILESINNHDLQIGAWLNVIGYVQRHPDQTKGKHMFLTYDASEVQAIMVWNAGAIKVHQYEQALAADRDHPTMSAEALKLRQD